MNEGSRFCRAQVTAEVGGQAVACSPSVLDLPPNQPPQLVRISVPRPRFGDLIGAFNNASTLYGRTLTVLVTAGDEHAERDWTEHVYTTDENSVREEIQQRIWRVGRGKGTEADEKAELQSELLQRHDERMGRGE